MRSNAQSEIKKLKILIAYFSWSGNTKTVAEYIHKATGGELFEIKTFYPYEYNLTVDIAKEEQRVNARPKLTATVNNMDDYDTIFCGYPNWWGTIPMALFTFLESYDFTSKTIIPFVTHEGSGFGNSIEDIKKLTPNAQILNGFIVRGANASRTQDAVRRWINQLKDGKL
jgi:flavodoxin